MAEISEVRFQKSDFRLQIADCRLKILNLKAAIYNEHFCWAPKPYAGARLRMRLRSLRREEKRGCRDDNSSWFPSPLGFHRSDQIPHTKRKGRV
jgi:hypothetical protein